MSIRRLFCICCICSSVGMAIMTTYQQDPKDIHKEIQEEGEQHINAEYIDRFCNSVPTVLDNLSFEEKRTILREVIDKIVVKDNKVSIYGIIPLQEESDDLEDVSIAYRSS